MAVRIETDGPVWTVIHDRPEARNAMDPASADALVEAFLAFEDDADAAVAVLWGAGGAFCAGWDLKYVTTLMGRDNPLPELAFPERGHNRTTPRGPLGPTRLEMDKPVIAAVAGPAVAGGMELAMWCDVRVMEEDAYFGVYCRRWGVPLIDGGTIRLPRLIGMSRALDLILTGRAVGAAEALEMGLANRVCAPGRARAEAEALAQQIARFPQVCLRGDRMSAYEQWDLSLDAALANELDHGRLALEAEAVAGAARFAGGKGRGGGFDDI